MNTTSRVVVVLSAGLFCFFAFRTYLPFPIAEMEVPAADTSSLVDNYGLDRFEEEELELSDDHWLPEIAVGGVAGGAVAGHLLDTIDFAAWQRYTHQIVLNHNFGNIFPLHPAQQVKLVRPVNTIFPVFSNDLGERTNFREFTWEGTLPTLPEACEEQEITLLLLDHASLSNFKADFAGLMKMYSEQPLVILFFGQSEDDYLAQLPVPVLFLPDNAPTSQAMAAQLLYGAQNLNMSSGGMLAASRLGHCPPEVAGIDREKLASIDDYVQRAIRKKAIPGCQVLVAKAGHIVYDKTFGYHTYDKLQPVDPQDVYDLASLTKAAGTTLAVMELYDKEKVDLSERLQTYLPAYQKSGLKYLRLRHLLAHQTGLQANLPIAQFLRKDDLFHIEKSENYLTAIGKDFYIKNGVRDDLLTELGQVRTPRRPFYRYSDVNFLLLQQVVEEVAGQPLDTYLQQYFYNRMGLHRLQFRPGLQIPEEEIVPTELDKKWRKQVVRGEVHDESALLLGGVAGHAGLFSNARDLAVVFQMLLNHGSYGGQQFLQPATIDKFTSRNGYNYRGFGFDRLAGHSKSLQAYGASKETFGHTGFTGTCVWADPDNDLVFIFLSNRIYPDKYNNKLQKLGLRERIHKIIYQSLDSFQEEV
ncbi:serine hydrolase domain-containing protein [Lewinella sp. LCG006]|uniref:serine hydrolase domain-containing protein n=1 Tax=Lewinella sp. LCG006 TaxID=3231911 RepID=UPI00345F7C12